MCGNRILQGKYELKEKIGEGACGVVYLAWDRHMERLVAVKEERLPKEACGVRIRDNAILRVEMEMLKTLEHPMLPAVYDYFQDDSRYLVMEYIKGISLHNYIEKEGSVAEEQACIWALQLIELFSYLHTRKPPILYRDLKPENIIVCPDGNLRVIDFGTAVSVRYDKYGQGSIAGTRGYAAPEIFGENKISESAADERSDIYTLGATLYHMLTGYHPAKPPYGIRPVRSIAPHLSRGIEEIVMKCTQPAREKRYQTIEEVKKDLLRKKYLGKRHLWGRIKERESHIIRKMEKKIQLTEKRNVGLFSIVMLTGITVMGIFSLSVKGKETPLPVTVYNTKGQKLVIRYDSVYQTNENLILELEKELFESENVKELSIKLTDSVTKESRERIFYIQ